jgi:hypothetical protein
MGKMPPKVVKYFKLLNSGKSKVEARKLAGLPPSKGRKKWGPGHPLYEWRKKHASGKGKPKTRKRKTRKRKKR